MDRRRFIGAGAAAVAAASLGLRSTAGAAMARRLTRIGLELYAVRDAMRRDPEGTLVAVRAMGYTDVELLWSFDNFGRTTAQVRDSLAAAGLKAPSAHIAPEILLAGWPASLETARTLGHEYLIVPSLPAETKTSLDAWRTWADHFNRAGEAARAAGIWLAFHNEPDHQKPIAGRVPYDLFVERTDPRFVRLQLDVGNMTQGGGDPVAYLRAHRDRYWSFHLKDILPDRSRDTELGTGNVPLARLLAMVSDIERKPCYVEQEGSADPLASARQNFRYLADLEF